MVVGSSGLMIQERHGDGDGGRGRGRREEGDLLILGGTSEGGEKWVNVGGLGTAFHKY